MLFLHYLEQLDNNRSQKRSNCGKNIRDTLSWHLVLPPPFFLCHLLTFVIYNRTDKWRHWIFMIKWFHSFALCILTVLKTPVTRGMIACSFQEQSIVFQSKDMKNIDNSLKLLNKHNDFFFFLHNFGVQFIPFELGKSKKIIWKWGNFGPSCIINKHGDLSLLLYIWKQILVRNIGGKF